MAAYTDSTRRCTRVLRDGTRCQLQAIKGGTVCHMHGGAAKHIRRKAQERLLAGADIAISALLNISGDKTGKCPTCGRNQDPRAVVGASTAVLDRAGLGPKSIIEIEHNDEGWLRHLTDDEFDAVAELMLKAQSRMPAADLDFLDDEPEEPVH
jgi:hypothetical protein